MIDIKNIDFKKCDGLVPAIIKDVKSNSVLMLGFMNKEALQKTIENGKVTFYSRTKQRLWTKGETSGNYLFVQNISTDCDNDSLLIRAVPAGNTCHSGSYSCFESENESRILFLEYLFNLIKKRNEDRPQGSYTTKLFNSGADRIIQKVGEEAVETVIAAKNRDKEEITNETADLIYHLFVMLVEQGINFEEIISVLQKRHKE